MESSPRPGSDPRAGEPLLVADRISRRFGDAAVLSELSLTLLSGEFFTLLGPSGCGKTTLLRIIAGLDAPDSGTLTLLGRDARDWPAHERPVNTVFQSYALFPHLSVRENVAFGLRMKRVPKPEIPGRVDAALERVRARELADRMPESLSGGQKQRVALARALVNQPRLLLLDEPLAALDLQLRKDLQEELRPLQRALGMTFLYVTHDQGEALALSDRIAIFNRGRLEQLGTPAELYDRPRTRFVAEFLGGCCMVPGTLLAGGRIRTPWGELSRVGVPSGKPGVGSCSVGIRAERVQIVLEAPAAETLNTLPARVVETRWMGAEVRWELECGGHPLRAVTLAGSAPSPAPAGTTVWVTLPAESLHVFPDGDPTHGGADQPAL